MKEHLTRRTAVTLALAVALLAFAFGRGAPQSEGGTTPFSPSRRSARAVLTPAG